MSDNHVVSTAHACPTHRMEKTFSFVATTVIRWLTIVLVLRFHYCKQPMNFGSGGSSELRVSPGHSSRKRHRNAYTQNHLRTLVLKFKRQSTWLSTWKGICRGIHKLEKTTFAQKTTKCAYEMPHGGGKTANGTFQDFN